ncbi:hypothetical protein JRQ81_010879 [Phrynocephalus forsythii]|uniref:Snake toxin/toxin-like domain-containing protein n=1 Tax=Phrynocephalus forsythii TaxID=171643 RepID=A0A9Q1B4Z3_9SAUR|nr:hypothetical protein JRQ81_010879 [Phrynocephalus forsythii]
MKWLLAAWITFLASLGLAVSLKCYTCHEPTALVTCVSITNCSMETTACKTTLFSVDPGYPLFGNVTVQKSCSKECIPSELDVEGPRDYCCYEDMCNLNAGQPTTATFSARTLAATPVFTILWTRF